MLQSSVSDRKMQLVDWLDDLCVRFIINLPHEELESVARICFQVEEAQWFYEDFVRPTDPSLPSLHLKDFCLAIFRHCPLLSAFSGSQHLAAYQEFLGYKTRVPVRGAILLNHDMDQVLLVKGWKKNASWSFPRGKINKDEKDLDCAIREVYEETGYDINAAGLVGEPDDVKAIDVTMREQHIRLFCFRSVPQNTEFAPRTRKEISKIEWYNLTDLPAFKKGRVPEQGHGQDLVVNANKFYMVAPFLGPLKKWIKQQHKLDAQQAKYGDLGEITEDGFATEPTQDYMSHTYDSHPQRSIQDETMQLKQLLKISGNTARQQPALPRNEVSYAERLLTALRGPPSSGLQPPPRSGDPLHTPIEQIENAFPPEPSSPHHRRPLAHESVGQQPPPNFGLMPQHHGQRTMHGQNVPGQAMHHLSASGMRPSSPDSRLSAPQEQSHQPQNQHLMSAQLAPASSQLPAPDLNKHTMSLLNAFRAKPEPAPSEMSGPKSVKGADDSAQAQTPHQTSLLDLFRRPSVPTASAAPPPDSQPLPHKEINARSQVAPAVQSTGRPTEHARRKSSAISMFTRTLPKQSTGTFHPPMPQINALHVAPAKTAAAKCPIAKQSVPAIKAAPEATATQSPQITILQRPILSGAQAAMSGPEKVVPSQSRTAPPSKRQGPRANPVMQILSRPGSTASNTDGSKTRTPKPAATASLRPRQESPFQPQVLKRPDSSHGDVSPGTGRGQSTENKRDELLALFGAASVNTKSPLNDPSLVAAEQAQAEPRNRVTAAMPTIDANLQSRQAHALPRHSVPSTRSTHDSAASALLGALSAQRASVSSPSVSALPSPSSLIGRGVPSPIGIGRKFSAGPQSPASPAEAKDFLLDFLKGVK